MARESAAQKKAREAEEAKQADQAAGGDGAPAAPDLLKFVNPEAAQAEAEAQAQAEVAAADQAAADADAQPVADGKDDEGDTPVAPDEAIEPAKPATTEPETTETTSNSDREYVVIVDSIGLGPAQVATRGETLRLNASRAQRLLSLKAVCPA